MYKPVYGLERGYPYFRIKPPPFLYKSFDTVDSVLLCNFLIELIGSYLHRSSFFLLLLFLERISAVSGMYIGTNS